MVLLDLRLPHLSGIEVIKRVRSQGLQTRFLVLTTYDTDEYIAPALAAGAQGYLLKEKRSLKSYPRASALADAGRGGAEAEDSSPALGISFRTRMPVRSFPPGS